MLDLVHTPSNELIERLFRDIVLDIDIKPIEIIDSPAPIYISPKLSPDDKIKRAFSLLKRNMEQALDGGLDPAIYVMSADAGTGKSTAVQTLLAEWKSEGFPGDGAIIFLNTLAEIDAYVAGAKLDKSDYAVYSSNPAYAGYGAGKDAAGTVPVLFATHSMAHRRLPIGPSYAEAEYLHYRGKPRALRVWDEGFHPVEYAAFDLNDLRMLPGALKGHSREAIKMLEALLPDRAKITVGHVIPIPREARSLADTILKSKLKLSERVTRTVQAIGKLAGSSVQLNGSEEAGWTCIGIGNPIPADIMPLFVLDASARLTGRYCDWSAYGMKVVALEPASIRYSDLTVHIWNHGCGQTAMRTPKSRQTIMGAVANLINAKPTEDFLLVMAKEFSSVESDNRSSIPDDLACLITNTDRVKVITWGRHLASNEHRDVANVVLFGSYSYVDSAYDALSLATTGSTRAACAYSRRRERDAEFKSNVYQAVCRIRCRNQIDGECLAASVYLIMTDSDARRATIHDAFPDCKMQVWSPVIGKLAKWEIVLQTLLRLLDTRTIVSAADLRDACESKQRSFLTKINKQPRFNEALGFHGIKRVASTYVRPISLGLAA
jgi:hypothetical protein